MQRRLFDFYHHHLARHVARLPEGLRAALAGFLYRVTRHPDFGFVHARSLVARGLGPRAAQLYGTPVTDPLFKVSLTPEGCASSAVPGVFQAQIGYLGLRVSADLPLAVAATLSLEIDGICLRQETLQPQKGQGQFRMILPRPVLARFPQNGFLQIRLGDQPLCPPGGGAGWRLAVPHGTGTIANDIAQRGLLEKKGQFRPDADMLQARQDGYLALYDTLRTVFAERFNRPLLVLYGTLLGQVRSGDFIPGDDDFDVGYPSRAATPAAVRAEAIDIMCQLAECGFTIVLNETGRPFRVRAGDGPVWCHLDNRPIYCPGDGHIWLHKQARLKLPLKDFETGELAVLRGQTVLRPQNPEAFLRAYYGPRWKVPDPGYSNASKGVSKAVKAGLAQICLGPREQRDLAARYPGQIVPVRWQALYPLEDYDLRIGF